MKTDSVKLLKRFSAYLLDILFIFVLLQALFSIKFLNPSYDKYIKSSEDYAKLVENYQKDEISEKEFLKSGSNYYYEISKNSISYNIITISVLVLYFGVFQRFNNGQTLGKKIQKIKVVDLNNNTPNIWKFILRLLPMYFVFIGCISSITINLILLFIVKNSSFMMVSTVINYILIFVNVLSLSFMNNREDKRGIHELISKTKVINE